MPMPDDKVNHRMVRSLAIATALGSIVFIIGLSAGNMDGALVAAIMIWVFAWWIGAAVL